MRVRDITLKLVVDESINDHDALMTMLMLDDTLPETVVSLSTLSIGGPRDATRDEAESMGGLEDSDSDGE